MKGCILNGQSVSGDNFFIHFPDIYLCQPLNLVIYSTYRMTITANEVRVVVYTCLIAGIDSSNNLTKFSDNACQFLHTKGELQRCYTNGQ